jgi:hypothetical protein
LLSAALAFRHMPAATHIQYADMKLLGNILFARMMRSQQQGSDDRSHNVTTPSVGGERTKEPWI